MSTASEFVKAHPFATCKEIVAACRCAPANAARAKREYWRDYYADSEVRQDLARNPEACCFEIAQKRGLPVSEVFLVATRCRLIASRAERERAEFVRMRKEGKTPAELQEFFGQTPKTLYHWSSEEGAARKSRVEETRRMLREGRSNREIAAALGISVFAVRKTRRNMGMTSERELDRRARSAKLDEYLANHDGRVATRELLKASGWSRATCRKKLREKGQSKRLFSPFADDVVRLVGMNWTASAIATAVGISRRHVRSIALARGVKPRPVVSPNRRLGDKLFRDEHVGNSGKRFPKIYRAWLAKRNLKGFRFKGETWRVYYALWLAKSAPARAAEEGRAPIKASKRKERKENAPRRNG